MAQTAAKPAHKHHGDFIRRSRGEKIADGVLLLFMILLLCFFLYPLLNMFSISLSDEYAVLRADVTFYPIGFNPQAYDLIFQSQDLWRSIGNSLFVAIVGCALSLAGLSLAAYPLAFAQFYGKKLYSFLILFTMWFQGGIIPQFLTIQQLGLYDSLWALIMNLLMSAYYVVIVKSYFQSSPVSIVDRRRERLPHSVPAYYPPVQAGAGYRIAVGHREPLERLPESPDVPVLSGKLYAPADPEGAGAERRELHP